MAKKAATKGKAAKGKKGAKPKRAARKLTQGALPTMEQVRNVKLDTFCESIGRIRDKVNALKSDEKEDMSEALAEMQRTGTTQHTHHGVTLIRMTGSDTLVVRRAKEGGESAATVDAEDGVE